VDEFLEAALKWMSGGRIDPRAVPSSSVRAQIIGAMLGAGRYLFVLDGLEVMQHQEGDRFGLLQSNDLRDLLTYFARPDNASFCLVTSRAPLLDLMEYTTYTHRDVDRLSATDGRALLWKLGVQGKDDALDKLVADWDGHALTLSLLSAILTERYGGDVARVADLPAPTMNEPRYERVHRVLRRYDEHLTDAEREFLKLFSAFRTPVREDAIEKVFVPLLHITTDTSRTESAEKNERKNSGTSVISVVKSLVERLVTYRILRFDARDLTYTTHPLIRNHYLALLTKGDAAQEKAAHEQIKDYYLSIAGDTPEYPTLDDLKPLIEVVHHSCFAGAYDEAYNVYQQRISQRNRFVIVYQLGAYETALALMVEFFPNGNTSQEPQVGKPQAKRFILNEIGLCLMSLGHLREALLFYERGNAISAKVGEWYGASRGYNNLAELHASLGALEASANAAARALDLARRAEDKFAESQSLSQLALVAHLRGELQLASEMFTRAEKTEQEHTSSVRYLYSNRGIFHAEHLRRTGNADYARRITEANLKICEQQHWANQISWCHRVLGDLDADAGQHASARAHYDNALKIARSISERATLIEALLARGRWAAKFMKDATSAFNDLNEALGYAVESGYRIYEADIRVALAWGWTVDSGQWIVNREKARTEAERALRMSEEMGYYWGKVDAEEVLKEISKK
jgi:tetratricopeptide (TPR) repeat protein